MLETLPKQEPVKNATVQVFLFQVWHLPLSWFKLFFPFIKTKGTFDQRRKKLNGLIKISVNGGYTDFGSWSECSAECGEGTQTRSRTCTNPAPANGGSDCVGEASQTRPCKERDCPGIF